MSTENITPSAGDTATTCLHPLVPVDPGPDIDAFLRPTGYRVAHWWATHGGEHFRYVPDSNRWWQRFGSGWRPVRPLQVVDHLLSNSAALAETLCRDGRHELEAALLNPAWRRANRTTGSDLSAGLRAALSGLQATPGDGV